MIRATHAEILKEYPKAIESYEALAKRSPGDLDVLLRLADLYEKNGNLDQARTILEKVHTIDPKNVPVLLAEARVELKSNNPQKGLQDLNSALTLSIQLGNDEQKANILQAIGVGYEDLQRPEDALRSYQESLDIKRRLRDEERHRLESARHRQHSERHGKARPCTEELYGIPEHSSRDR